MIVRRAAPTKNFTVFDNALLNDERLGVAALGLLVYLLSKPANWHCSIAQLRQRFQIGTDGLRAIRDKLSEAGYLRVKTLRMEDGSLAGKGWEIYDTPCGEPVEGAPEDGEAAAGEGEENDPVAGASHAENAGLDEGDHRSPENPSIGEKSPPPIDGFSRSSEKPSIGVQRNEYNKTPPLTPRRGGGGGSRDGGEGWTAAMRDGFDRLRLYGPWRDADDRALRAFGRLPDADRALALEKAGAYRAWCERFNHPVKSLSNWLRGQDFAQRDYATPPPPVFVRVGTPGFDAWAARWRRERGFPEHPPEGAGPGWRPAKPPTRWRRDADGAMREGWEFPSLFPPAEAARDGPSRAA